MATSPIINKAQSFAKKPLKAAFCGFFHLQPSCRSGHIWYNVGLTEQSETIMQYTRAQNLPEILKQRIVVLDGAMGTMIQRYKLTESDYRGERFNDHHIDVKGNNELLILTRPDIISEIHEQ